VGLALLLGASTATSQPVAAAAYLAGLYAEKGAGQLRRAAELYADAERAARDSSGMRVAGRAQARRTALASPLPEPEPAPRRAGATPLRVVGEILGAAVPLAPPGNARPAGPSRLRMERLLGLPGATYTARGAAPARPDPAGGPARRLAQLRRQLGCQGLVEWVDAHVRAHRLTAPPPSALYLEALGVLRAENDTTRALLLCRQALAGVNQRTPFHQLLSDRVARLESPPGMPP